MFERFDEPARRVMVLAQQAARSLNHDHVGTEHLMLGTLGVEPATGHIPFTPRAKKSLELALREAISLGHKEIRPAHLMIGILRERDGVGVRALGDLGLDIDELITNISDEYSRKYSTDQ